jgi:hypothetical protein
MKEHPLNSLSPAAQAVIDAYWATPNEPVTTKIHQAAVAAALRAVAEIVAPIECEKVYRDGRWHEYDKVTPTREKLLSIANELEAGLRP